MPQQQMAVLDYNTAYADRSGERRTQRCAVADLDDAAATLALLWFAGALELGQVRTAGPLAELEPAACDLEVSMAEETRLVGHAARRGRLPPALHRR